VARTAGESDGRVAALEVTEAGTDLLAHHRRRLRDAALRLHRALPASSRTDAARLLDMLGEVFDELP
jgi:DNA-binding MarR family transcriptional regulator